MFHLFHLLQYGRRGGFMVRALVFTSSSPGSSSDRAFLIKPLYSHSASLHADESMGHGQPNARGNPVMD